MTDLVLRDIDPALAGRIRALSKARGWSTHETLLQLLEHGLYHCEGNGERQLDHQEDDALRQAICAMEQVPDDPGFALIGRVQAAEEPPGNDDAVLPPEDEAPRNASGLF